MVIENSTSKKIMLVLLKHFSKSHTITSLSKELKISRVGMWKILKKLQSEQFIVLTPVGTGKTSIYIAKLNWDDILVKKSLALYLTEESLKHRRWRVNFCKLEKNVSFLILYGSIIHTPKQANDIDIIGVVSKKKNFLNIQRIIDKEQKILEKKIHIINFTGAEFKDELIKHNKTLIDAVEKGVILFGQENFVTFMKRCITNGA